MDINITALSNLLQESEEASNNEDVNAKSNSNNNAAFLTPASIGAASASTSHNKGQIKTTSLPFYLQPAVKKEKKEAETEDEIASASLSSSFSSSSLGPIGVKAGIQSKPSNSLNTTKSAAPAKFVKAIEGSGQDKDNANNYRSNSNDIWSDDKGEVPDEEQLLCERDGRPSPKFQFYYKQNVGTEDVFLGMSDVSPSSYDCSHLVVKIFFPGEKMKDIDLDVTKRRISAQSTKFKLFTYLPVPVDSDEGSAKFDSKKEILIVTLPILIDEM